LSHILTLKAIISKKEFRIMASYVQIKRSLG